MSDQPMPGREHKFGEVREAEVNASEPCPWCAKTIVRGSEVVDHFVGTPEGLAPLATLHATCSFDQAEHEGNFG